MLASYESNLSNSDDARFAVQAKYVTPTRNRPDFNLKANRTFDDIGFGDDVTRYNVNALLPF